MKKMKVFYGANIFHKRLFVPTGSVRPPKKGEWFLSGAIPEAYEAFNDLTTPYHILKEFPERRIKDRRQGGAS